jgi:hypothetical protein
MPCAHTKHYTVRAHYICPPPSLYVLTPPSTPFPSVQDPPYLRGRSKRPQKICRYLLYTCIYVYYKLYTIILYIYMYILYTIYWPYIHTIRILTYILMHPHNPLTCRGCCRRWGKRQSRRRRGTHCVYCTYCVLYVQYCTYCVLYVLCALRTVYCTYCVLYLLCIVRTV